MLHEWNAKGDIQGMNGYWKKEDVSLDEALGMAQELWRLCEDDIREHDRYWRLGGNAKMGLEGCAGTSVVVWYSTCLHCAGVAVERRGLKESMTYNPRLISRRCAWKHDPSCRDEMDDLHSACVSALERYRESFGGKSV